MRPTLATLRRRAALPATVLLLALYAGDAAALCTVVCSCTVSTTPVAFGTINPLSSSSTDSTGSVKVSCGGVAGLLIPFRIDIGTGASGSYAMRRLKSGAASLNYNLYLDGNRLTVWGDGSSSSQPANASMLLDVLGLSPAHTQWIYGRIPGAQSGTVPGVYTDSVGVTLTYF